MCQKKFESTSKMITKAWWYKFQIKPPNILKIEDEDVYAYVYSHIKKDAFVGIALYKVINL